MSNCMMPQGHPTHCGCEPERNPFFNPEPAASMLRERAKLAQPEEAEGVEFPIARLLDHKRDGAEWMVRAVDHDAAPSAVTAERDKIKADRKACWEEFKVLVKSSCEKESYLQGEIDQLRAEVERLAREAKNDAIAYRAVIERQEELRAEVEGLRKDAERYRMFRRGMFDPDRFDADIDAAMAAITNKESKL